MVGWVMEADLVSSRGRSAPLIPAQKSTDRGQAYDKPEKKYEANVEEDVRLVHRNGWITPACVDSRRQRAAKKRNYQYRHRRDQLYENLHSCSAIKEWVTPHVG